MSHVATINLEVKDLDALAEAAKRIGMELIRDHHSFETWWTQASEELRARYLARTSSTIDDLMPPGFTGADMGRCDHMIRLKGNKNGYEIGIVRRRDGRPGYLLLMEDYESNQRGEQLAQIAGSGAVNLKREYATCVARKQAMAQGYRVNEQRQKDGSIRLLLTR